MSQSLDTLTDFEPLSATDARVLGCLIEKQLTTPEAYPLTLNELLTRSQRMHDFDDTEEVRHQLERLAGRGMALQLERLSGQREDRYMHLLGTEEDREAAIAASGSRASSERSDSGGHDEGRLVELEGRIAALEERLALLEMGIPRD